MSRVDSKSLEDRRPLSPHLSIYRPMLTMMMSIVHRITGAALYVGTLLVAWYLIAAASGPQAFAPAAWFFKSFVGELILFGFSWSLFHHALGGVRHMIWDAGYGFDPVLRERLAQATIVGSLSLTIILWVFVLWFA